MKQFTHFRLALIFSFLFFISSLTQAADQVVTTNANSGAGSLRQAITDVTDGGSITFNLSAGNETITIASEIAITKAMTINGANTSGSGVAVTVKVTTPGTSAWRLLTITASGSTINIQNMTMLGGSTGGDYGGVIRINSGATVNLSSITMSNGKSNYGGGVFLTGSTTILNVSNSTLSNNITTGFHGGWVYNEGSYVEVNSCTFSGNTGVCGGAIFNATGGARLVINSCEFTSNSGNGGAVYNEGTVTINGSTINGNSSTGDGGGLLSWGTMTISSSTISGNSCAGNGGGGVFSGGTLIITSSTISGNSVTGANGGGINNWAGNSYLLNTIIINNTAASGNDIRVNAGALYAYYSWYNGTSGTISTQATAPNVTTAYVSGNLSALANNGGNTRTMAVSATAPAAGAGAFAYYNATDGYYFLDNQGTPVSHKLISWATSPTVVAADKITTDQRGASIFPRPTIGAYYNIPVHVSATTGASSGDYYTLKAAFDAINAGTHKGVITIYINGSTTETSSAVLNASSGSASYASVNIYPTVSGLTISGNLGSPLIDFNGADNVTIDGRVGAAGSSVDLTISNNSIGGGTTSTIRFNNDATANTVKYCLIKGSSVASNSGILYFASTTVSTGNSYNTIDNNQITNAGSRPINALYSNGSATASNISNTVSNNSFYNFLSNSGNPTCGILLGIDKQTDGYNSAWTITGNSFYETTTFAPNAGGEYRIISIRSYVGSPYGDNFTVSNNYIGGSGPGCTGTFYKSNGNNYFWGIEFHVGSANASSVQGNVIKNMKYINTSIADWWGIYVDYGAVNIGTVSPNYIGSASDTGSIFYSCAGAGSRFLAVHLQGDATNFQNNVIGSITVANQNSAYSTSFWGIHAQPRSGTNIISNNTIGSATVANSIKATSPSTSNAQVVIGYYNQDNQPITLSNNTIANLTNGTTNTTATTQGAIYGVWGRAGRYIMNGNSIHDLTIANANNAGSFFGARPA